MTEKLNVYLAAVKRNDPDVETYRDIWKEELKILIDEKKVLNGMELQDIGNTNNLEISKE